MEEILLELGGFHSERKLYTADSLNDLHKMSVCSDLQDLMAVALEATHRTGLPVHLPSSQRNGSPGVRAEPELSQDSPKTGVVHCGKGGTEEGCEEKGGNRTQSTRSRLLTIILLILAIALISSLALSSYAVYLMVQTTERLGQLSSSQVEHSYLAELRQWKALMSQQLEESAGGRAK